MPPKPYPTRSQGLSWAEAIVASSAIHIDAPEYTAALQVTGRDMLAERHLIPVVLAAVLASGFAAAALVGTPHRPLATVEPPAWYHKKMGLELEDAPEVSRHTRPNVLVIVWDTTRADRLSAYGYHRDTTPGLAALADESVLFEHAVSPAIWTVPSHASMFTGLSPRSHGADFGHIWLDHRFPTMAEWAQDLG